MTTHPLLRLVSLASANSATVSGSISISEVLSRIKEGFVKDNIARLRAAKEAEACGDSANTTEVDSDAIKRSLPAVMFSGTFTSRNKKNVKDRSGVVVMDLDHVGFSPAVREKIQSMPQTLACFTSPSGDGLKVLFHGDATRDHLDTFLAAKGCMEAAGLGEYVDDSGKDISRLCFFSYDPDVFTNPDAVALSYDSVERAVEPEARGWELDPELPGDDYDLRGDFPGLLKKHGWVDIGNGHWQRPGKDSGTSATLGVVSGMPNGFHVFTSNAKPLEENKTYRPWKVMALLEFGGDEGLAVAWLTAHGFGGRKAVSAATRSILPNVETGSSTDIAKALAQRGEELATELKDNDTKQREFGAMFAEQEDPIVQERMRKVWAEAKLNPKTLTDLSKKAKAQIKEAREQKERAEEAVANESIINETQNTSPIFYCEETEKYYRRIGTSFNRMNRQDTLLELAIQGLSRECGDNNFSPAEEALNRFQKSNSVDAAGLLCGRPIGLHVLSQGVRYLVTKGPTVVKGVPGEFPTIRRVLETLTGVGVDPDGQGQFDRLIWWIKYGRIALANYKANLPGHALFLVGPRNAGKTFFQSHILRPLLGGREANPMGYMTDRTTFNSDLWKAELLSISDGVLGNKPSYAAREMFKGRVKELIANETQPFHPKGKEQMHLTPIWRIVLSFNTDYSSMQNIPSISESEEDSFADKVLMLLCHKGEPMFDPTNDKARGEFDVLIRKELAAFAHFVDSSEVPPDQKHTRLGFKAWCHPWVLGNLHRDTENAPELMVARWIRSDTVNKDYRAKRDGSEGVIVAGELDAVYDKAVAYFFGSAIEGMETETVREFKRACNMSQFKHVLERLSQSPEMSNFVEMNAVVKIGGVPGRVIRVWKAPEKGAVVEITK